MPHRLRLDGDGKVTEKLCSSCGEWKPTSEFTKSNRYVGGLNFECKECKALRAAIDYENNAEARKAAAQRYRQEHPDKVRQTAEAYKPRRRLTPIPPPDIPDTAAD